MGEQGGQTVYPTGLEREGDDRLVIEWSDGVRHVLPWTLLRESCPCAECRIEREKPQPLMPIIDPAQAQPPRPQSMEPVGRYAYQLVWKDGHSSGIYTFEFLRQLGQQSGSQEKARPTNTTNEHE